MVKVIITGSEGLIGSEVSSYLIKKGYEVVGCDLQLGDDLLDENYVKEWFSKNQADYLVNLYAYNPHVEKDLSKSKISTNLFDISLDSLDHFLRVNLTSLFCVCREFARNNTSGGIVNISSIYGIVSPLPKLYDKNNEKHIGYALSKSGVVQLTKYLSAHLAPNFRINCIAPGGVDFKPRTTQTKKFKKKYNERVLLERMMKVNELNGLIKYLCSSESSYVTGSVISVDGGWTAI